MREEVPAREAAHVGEVAITCGRPRSAGDLAPMRVSSRGFGEAVTAGARRTVLCSGGSASTEGGAGTPAALASASVTHGAPTSTRRAGR
jgi:glycerate kinase